MTETEFGPFRAQSLADYIEERARNNGTSVEREREIATQRYDQLLPEGVHSKGQRLWTLVADDGAAVGWLWVEVDEEATTAFILDITLHPDQRGKGYGGQALTALEAELRPQGIRSIGLNVFADNAVARHLYARQGYRRTNQNMAKWLTDPPTPQAAAPGVQLQPMTEAEFETFRDWAIEEYAQETARNLDAPLDRQRRASAREINGLLTDGVHTPGQRLWTIRTADGTFVGNLWVRAEAGRIGAFIYYILLDPAQRGKGYGGQALTALEAALRPLAIERIGLNVFADNAIAERLYAKMGYQITSQEMRKAL
jgi:ribosomal protein S18 acetylase RimI-like enzyme